MSALSSQARVNNPTASCGVSRGDFYELYPAKLLLEGLGGNLSVSGEKGKGVTYMITVPKRWQSYL